MSERLTILSAGAAESLVARLWENNDLGTEIEASFGAVGAMKESFLAGATCELFITSARVMADLQSSGQLKAERVGDLGWVQTGLAIRATDPVPDVSTSTAVAQALRAAPALFFPDPVKSTAGVHFSKVLGKIGISAGDVVALRPFPNGAAAMRALAASQGPAGALGCTQVTEILQTKGLRLAGPLPEPYKLATRYQCALLASGDGAGKAVEMYELLTGDATTPLRAELGMHEMDS